MSWVDEPPDDAEEPDGSKIEDLIFLIERQPDLIIDIATGTSITPRHNGIYTRRRRKIRAGLARLQVADPYPWPDLSQWWGYCAAPRFTTYRERRAHVHAITEPVLEELDLKKAGITDWTGETGAETWATVETRLMHLKERLDAAVNLDDWQDVGRRAREVLIAATNVVFNDDMVPEGQATPQGSNAKARFDLVLEAWASGNSHAELRLLMRSSWDLAQKVTHSGGITRVDAFATAQATVVLVRILQELQRETAGE